MHVEKAARIRGQVRHVLTAAGPLLVAIGVMPAEQADALVGASVHALDTLWTAGGALMTLGAMVWSWVDKPAAPAGPATLRSPSGVLLVALALAVTLGACATMRTIAPQTTAGFEANGILGALDGASGAILARCRALDGQEMRVAIDTLAGETATAGTVAAIRERRLKACAVAGAVAMLDGAALVPIEAPLLPPAPPIPPSRP